MAVTVYNSGVSEIVYPVFMEEDEAIDVISLRAAYYPKAFPKPIKNPLNPGHPKNYRILYQPQEEAQPVQEELTPELNRQESIRMGYNAGAMMARVAFEQDELGRMHFTIDPTAIEEMLYGQKVRYEQSVMQQLSEFQDSDDDNGEQGANTGRGGGGRSQTAPTTQQTHNVVPFSSR